MAYSPVNQGVLDPEPLRDVAAKHGINRFQLALAWLLARKNVIVIPKASTRDHIAQNHAATVIVLDQEDLDRIDTAFPPPDKESPLDII